MATASQGVSIWGKKDKWVEEDSDLLIVVKKTGYYNFWINGKHYYADEREDKSSILNSVSVYAFNGGQSQEKKKKKKGKITVKKKKRG